MEHTVYKVACKGDIKPIKEISDQQLNLIVTPNNNTILHVHITFCRQPSTRFVEEVLEICPLLLIQVNDHGDTPLHVAAKQRLVDIVKVLIKHAKAQHDDLEGKVAAVRQMLRMTNNDGNTALHEAAHNHNTVDVVKLLMKEDPDFPYNSANQCGETPLYIAASKGSLHVVVELLGTCTSTTDNYKSHRGMTILHAAIRRNHLDITRKILEKTNENGWSLTKETDENGWTALHYAAYYGHLSIVKLLLKFDATAACIADNCRKMTPLHLAAGQNYFNIGCLIIDSCPACLEQVDDRGWNYLHFNICSVGSFHFILRWRQHYWENYLLDAKDIKGDTPLFVLASVRNYMFDAIKKRVRREFVESTMQSIYNREEQSHQLKEEILVLSNIRDEPYKLGVISLKYKDIKLFDSIEKYMETFLLVNTLIATVSFTAGFTLPGGFIQEGQDKGTAILIRNADFQIFVCFNSVALYASASAVLVQVYQQFYRLKNHVKVRLLVFCLCLTMIALGSMVSAFFLGTQAMLKPSLGLVRTVNILMAFFCLIPWAYSAIIVHLNVLA